MTSTARIFTSLDIQACLHDRERVDLFSRAIAEVVRPGDVVVDAGSGTGLLGMLAVRAGARRAYCIEINEEYLDVIAGHALLNGMSDQIVVVAGDAAAIDLPESVDVLISEVISAGFFYEPQLQILANLQRFLKPNSTVIPTRMVNGIELVAAQEKLYGLNFGFGTRYHALPGDRTLSTQALYSDVDFRNNITTSITAGGSLTGTGDGIANAVRIPYQLYLTPSLLRKEPTEFLLNPQVVFLAEPIEVKAGCCYEFHLRYEAGASPMTLEVDLALTAS
ncbi:methyltransferase domain-containing protein [Nocardia sp. NPDC005978]|uniref:methyltransferase domain-containing protein n=1 Tax=Nocardia sp. NPDC005978 TaxID=3156725 RepID=UPI0033AB9F20